MKRFLLVVALLLSTLFATSQKVTVLFTGVDKDGLYLPFDSVTVTNLNRGWTVTLEYPDTTLALSGVGVDEFSSDQAGIIGMFPNPFNDFTHVDFSIPESGPVGIDIVGIDGTQKASWEGSLQAGSHRARITLDKPQMALVVITTGNDRYIGKLLQVGTGGGNTVELSDISSVASSRSVRSNRFDANGGFLPGDRLSCIGMVKSNGDLEVSETVLEAVYEDETITLVFPISQTPPSPAPIGTIYTIGDILRMESGTVFDKDASVYGVVTADERSGNLYKAIFIQDRATGDAIELFMNTSTVAKIGDYVRVYLKDVVYSVYHNLPQLKYFDADGHVFVLEAVDPIEPEETTIADILAGNHLAKLVKLSNVMFTEHTTFSEIDYTTNRILVDADDPSSSVIVRTSNYADFAHDTLPQGRGSLIAIATVYNTTWQLIIRSLSELEFDGVAPPPPTPPTPNPPGEVQNLPYVQLFESDFGTYSTYDAEGPQSWVNDYGTAKMTGYESGTNHANEDWLISSPVAITGVTDAKLTMSYIGRYFNDINSEVTLWASHNYSFGANPNEATWNRLSVTLVESANWSTFQTAEIDLTDYVGQTVTIAVKYVSTDSKAGTIEVRSIAIEEGTIGGGVTPPTPGTPTGDGSRENPFTASDIIALGIETSDDNKYWVKDYIVGTIDANYVYLFSSVTETKSNITLSSNVNTYNQNECVPIQLPVGVVRDGLNLCDNPQNYRQQVLLYGTLEKYFQVPGVKNVTYAEIGDVTLGVDPNIGPVVPSGEVQTMPYVQSFETEFGTYLTKNVIGIQAWEIAFSSAKMSGYMSAPFDNEDWLISAPVQITGVEHAKAVLNYAAKYDAPLERDITIQVSSNYEFNSDPSTATWTELSASFENNNKDWNFDELEVNLDEFIGQTVNLAIKYTSTTGGARTIEIKSITIEADE